MELSELWLYRTVPRLDLYKEIHNHLENVEKGDRMLEDLAKANKGLEHLQKSIGAVGTWHGKSTLKKQDKKEFSENVRGLCRAIDLQGMVTGLEELPPVQIPSSPSLANSEAVVQKY